MISQLNSLPFCALAYQFRMAQNVSWKKKYYNFISSKSLRLKNECFTIITKYYYIIILHLFFRTVLRFDEISNCSVAEDVAENWKANTLQKYAAFRLLVLALSIFVLFIKFKCANVHSVNMFWFWQMKNEPRRNSHTHNCESKREGVEIC